MAETSADKRRGSTYRGVPLVGVSVLVVVLAGLVVDANKPENDSFYTNLLRLDNVATKIHQSYVEDVSSGDLVDKAIEGMIGILDPHTTYFEEKQYEELRIHTEGEFGGLGIQIAVRDKVLTVMTPISGTPAARAGIQSGDQIVQIDGVSTEGITIDAAVGKLRGQPGTEVALTIRRKGEAKTLDFRVTREVIKIKSVPYYGMVADKIGYVRLLTFSQDAGSELERAMRALMQDHELKGMVFDLRSNPGGLLPQAIEVAEKFLPKKALVVSTRGREHSQNKEYYSTSSPVIAGDVPIAVLVGRSSASASEIVAGAIQDWDRGVIVGDTTFGKGSVQSILTLDKSHRLKLTTAFYYTPSGRCINKPENAVRGVKGGDESSDEEEGNDSVTVVKPKAASDSIKVDTATYHTKNGRTVHGGGGIIPDTVVQPEQYTPVIVSLFGKDVFFKFANSRYPSFKKAGVKIDANYQVDDNVMHEFQAYLDSMEFQYRSTAQTQFREFQKRVGLVPDSADSARRAAEAAYGIKAEEKLQASELTAVREASGTIERILQGASARAMKDEREGIKSHLTEAFLVRALGQDDGVVYRRELARDRQLSAAVAILQNRKTYEGLLTVSGKK